MAQQQNDWITNGFVKIKNPLKDKENFHAYAGPISEYEFEEHHKHQLKNMIGISKSLEELEAILVK